MKIGTKIKFDSEKQRYTLQAHSDRFYVLTKPFNAKQTYLYTIVDLDRKVRGACNLIFGLPNDCNNPAGAAEIVYMLEKGEMEVSYRICVDLSERELELFV